MRTCILNVANGGWYPRGQDRLKRSLYKVGYNGDNLFWKNSYPNGCPPHSKMPYAFKPYAFKQAKEEGYDLVLWVDSALEAVKSLNPIFERMEKDGYFLLLNGWKSGEWCSDACLEKFGKTREESMQYPHLMANCMGLDFRKDTSNRFLDLWMEKASDGVSFPGAWSNKNKEVSADARVLGHRHDQTAASFIAYDLGMRNWTVGEVQYYAKGAQVEPAAIFITYPAH